MKLGAQVERVTMTNRFDFGEDPDLDTRLESDSSPFKDTAKNIYSATSQIVASYNKTGWTSSVRNKTKPIRF